MDLNNLSNIAIKAALSAGKVILDGQKDLVLMEKKKAGNSLASQVLTQVDLASQSTIFSFLLPTCKEFDIALLSEESQDDGSRFKKDFFWCIDPLDGTLPFINNIPGFSVSIALVARDGTPHIGVVYDPSKDVLYHAIKGYGAFRNGQVWKIVSKNRHLSYITDHALELTPNKEKIVEILNKYRLNLGAMELKEWAGGGSVLNAIRVLEHSPAILIKLPKKEQGGGSLWDFAATVCIYNELGLFARNFKRGKLDLNKKDSTFMNLEGVFFKSF